MKKILLFLILLSLKNFAQTTYRVNVQGALFSCGCSSLGGEAFNLYDSNNNVITPTDADYTNFPNVSFETNIRPAKIIHQGTCEPTGDDWCYPFPYGLASTVVFSSGNCSYSTSTDGDPWGLKANLQEMNINNTGCITAGLSCSGSIERWEVKKVGSNVYQAIPNSNVNTLSLLYNQIYSDNSGINKTTYFRAKFTGTQVYTYHPFVFIPCSPTLTNTSNPNYTTCNYSNGEVLFTFSRPLDSNNNEKFIFSRNLVGNDLYFSSTSANEDVEKITDNVYKWKKIPAGTYDFSYQTQLGENSPSEAVKNLSFTITPKEKLKFEVKILQPACNDKLGKIEISAIGGNPPYYYYLGTETIANKHSFTSPYLLPNELVEGNYKITIIDSKDCIEKPEL
jgi:hypothetical protein